ncbi:MAG: SLC13 family permease [Alphaproteobacteria bacterium]
MSRLIALAAVLASVVIFFWPVPDGLSPTVMHAAAVATLTIGLLATVALPEFLTVLIFFFLCVVLTVAAPEVVFSGFTSSAVWLVFGGLILGAAIDITGLAARAAGYLERVFASSYPRVVTGTVLLMALLAFVMPSSIGRVVIMMPIVLALAARLGFDSDSNGRAGLALAVAMGAVGPTFAILPASVPNVAMAGAAEAIHGVQLAYSEYLLLHFPVIGVIGIIALPIFIVLMFPARIEVRADGGGGAPTPLTPEERRLLVILFTALALWATDTLHGVNPAWVSLGAAIVAILPGVGVMAPGVVLQRVTLGPILMLAGVIGLGAVVVQSGLGRVLGGWLIDALAISPGGGFGNFASVIGLGVSMGLITTLPGLPAIMTAFADALADATGWPLLTVLMAQVPSWALTMFPYQAPPLIAAKALSGLSVGRFIRLMLPFALFGWVVMVPLQYLWWRFLGYFS